MKAFRIICYLLVLVMGVSCIASCSNSEDLDAPDDRPININTSDDAEQNPEKGSINIFANGGTLATEEVNNFKSAVNLIPQKEGYVFAGWYSDEALTDYINPSSPTKAQVSKGCAYAKWLVVESQQYYIRTESETTVTDSGRAKQQMDVVSFSSDYKISDLINSGYKKLKISVSLDVRERDDGYQYIFLYSDTKCASTNINSIMDVYDKYIFGKNEADPSLIYMHKFTHGGDSKNTTWGTVYFTVTIDTDRLEDDLYIRYGASGKYSDDWSNKNLEVTITPVK